MRCRSRGRLTAALVVAAFVWGTTHLEAQQTRADEVNAARDRKAAESRKQGRSLIERWLFRIEDDLLLERWLAAPRGVYLRLGGVGESSGFGAGPAYRYNTAAFDFKTSAAMLYKRYTVAEASLRFPGTIGHDAYSRASGPYVEIHGRRRDLPQEDFFGLGPGSAEGARSNYALADTLAAITGGLARRNLEAGVTAGHLHTDVGRGTDSRMPSAGDVFSPLDVPGLAGAPRFVVFGPFVELQTRDRSIGDVDGGEYRASWNRHHDRTLGRYSFDRWDVDLRQYVSFVKRTRTIALRAWAASTSAADGHETPFYLQPSLGGPQTLRGYRTYRFRDRSALLLQAEYRWRINDLVSGALFCDSGAVAPALAELGRLERNYGFGLRAGGRMGSMFRMDVAFGGREGTRFLIRFDDAF